MNSLITAYFNEIELRLLENPLYKEYSIIRKDILYAEAKIRLKIRLVNEDAIDLFEFLQEIAGELKPIKYSFHWQDRRGTLKKRWDNAPHYMKLDNFPHHIHDNDSPIISNSFIPNILNILDEIEEKEKHEY